MDPSIDAEWWEDSDSGDVDGIISFKLGDPVDYELQCTWNGEGQILIGDGDFRHDIAADSSTEPPSVRCTNSENVVAGIITIQVEKVLTSEYPTERYELKLEITDFLGVDSEEEEFVIPSAIYEETIQFSYETTGSDV